MHACVMFPNAGSFGRVPVHYRDSHDYFHCFITDANLCTVVKLRPPTKKDGQLVNDLVPNPGLALPADLLVMSVGCHPTTPVNVLAFHLKRPWKQRNHILQLVVATIPTDTVRGSLATLPIGHLRPYPPKTHKRVTCDPTSFYCAGHTKLDLVTCDPTHPY